MYSLDMHVPCISPCIYVLFLVVLLDRGHTPRVKLETPQTAEDCWQLYHVFKFSTCIFFLQICSSIVIVFKSDRWFVLFGQSSFLNMIKEKVTFLVKK